MKLRLITEEEFKTGKYGECGEIYVEDTTKILQTIIQP